MTIRNRIVSLMLSAALTVGAAIPAAPVQVRAAGDDAFIAAMEGKFQNVSGKEDMKHRPYARWWLAEGSHTDETLKESIQELYDAGYGGVEFVTLTSESEAEGGPLKDATYGWGSPEWIHDSKLIIEECQKLGMSVSMTGGTYWATANLTTIKPDDQEASQELGYTTVELRGQQTYKGELPKCVLPGAEDGQEKQVLVSVVAAEVASWGSGEAKTKINTDSLAVVDKTKITEANGTYSVNYDAGKSGDYILFAFYQYGTSESYAAANTGKSYTINYFDKAGSDALKDYWDKNVLTEDVMALINQMEECALYMDSLELETKGENSTKQLWCDAMLQEFNRRRGYDLEAYLPLLIRETEDGIPGMGQDLKYVFDNTDPKDIDVVKLRNDFFQTETELYQENCLDVLADWLHGKNMKLRAEPSYGKTFEVSQTVSSLDYLETESFEFGGEVDSYRNFSGAAHVFGKRLSSETGASIFGNYKWNNGYYRQLFYTQYAAGIQKTVTHGYSSEYGPEETTSWPGYEGMTDLISERFNKRQPNAVDYADVNSHLTRIQKALEQGSAQVDIAMLRTDYYLNNMLCGLSNDGVYTNRLHSNQAYYWTDMELQNAGYTYDYFSPFILDDTNTDGDVFTVKDGALNADGVSYKALVVMQNELPYAAAEKLLAFAKEGLPILFVNNVTEDVNNEQVKKENTIAGSTTGSNDGKDTELAALVNQIKGQANVRTVETPADAYEALQALNVTPRASFGEANAKILTNMRKGQDGVTYLYVYNYMYEDTENYQGDISVEGIYQPYLLNTWNGEVVKVTDAFCTVPDASGNPAVISSTNAPEGGRTTLHIDLAPGDVAMYILDSGNVAVKEEDASRSYEIDLSKWKLSVDSYTPGGKQERKETNPSTNVSTTEVTYATNHTTIDVGTLEKLVPWKDIPAVGETVSGVGTYTNTFTLPDNWDNETDTLIFQADSFNYGTAKVEVNGEKTAVNMDSAKVDISNYVTPGENTITVRVTSSLRNVAKTIPSIYWFNIAPVDADAYGMTGNAKLISNSSLILVEGMNRTQDELNEANQKAEEAQKQAEETEKRAQEQIAAANEKVKEAEANKAQADAAAKAAQEKEAQAKAQVEALQKDSNASKAEVTKANEALKAAQADAQTAKAEAEAAKAALTKAQQQAKNIEAQWKFKTKKTTLSKATSPKKKQAKVTWKKVSGASGYQIQYALKSNFKGKKTVTIKKAKTTATTVKKLKSKKTYYFRMRAYSVIGGKKVYTAYSAAKSIKVK